MSNTGDIKITNEVVSSVAGAAATKIEGVDSLAGSLVDGINEMLGKKQFSKGISVNIEAEHKSIDLNLVVKHGYKIHEIARNVQTNVKKDVKNMIGLKIDSVNVYVDKVRIELDKDAMEEN